MLLLIVVALLPRDAYHDLKTGGKPLALGYAVTAQAAHPTSIFYNPASLSAAEQGLLVTHYEGVGFDSLGRIKGLSLILPELCLTYLALASARRYEHTGDVRSESWQDERYKVETYLVTVTSRTANAAFTEGEPFLIGLNLKYLRGSYSNIEWSYTDSAFSKPGYTVTDGDGYGFDAGFLIRAQNFQMGVMLKDVYSRMKWHDLAVGSTEKIDFIPRVGGALNVERASILVDIQKAGNDLTFHGGAELNWKIGPVELLPRGGAIFEQDEDVRYTVGAGIAFRGLFVDFGADLSSKTNALTVGVGM